MLLYHIVAASDWEVYASQDFYETPSLHTEGFIHLSTAAQVPGTLQRFFAGRTDLLLLHIETDKLNAELKFESVADHGVFPHLYGRLNADAIVAVEPA